MPTQRSDIETAYFYDVAHIIDPESSQGKSYAAQMEVLAKRVLGKDYDSAKGGIRFLLIDDPNIGGFTIPAAHPPVIALHKGVFEKVGSMDEVAAIIAHEYGHNIAEQKLGEHGNSKGEEMGADIYSLKKLVDAQMNGKAAEKLQARITRDYTLSESIISAVKDVHPLSINRKSGLEKARIALNRSGHITERPETPIPAALVAEMQTASFHSTVDITARAKAAGFENMEVPAKLDWLVEQAQTTGTLQQKGYEGMARKNYANQIITTLGETSVVGKPELHEAYHQAFTRLLKTNIFTGDHGESSQSVNLLRAADKGLRGENTNTHRSIEPIGVLRDLEVSMVGFTNAANREEAMRYAKEIVAFRTEYDVALASYKTAEAHALLNAIKTPKIVLPNDEEIRAALARGEHPTIPLAIHDEWAGPAGSRTGGDEAIINAKKILLGGYGAKNVSGFIGSDMDENYKSNLEIQGGKVLSILPEQIAFPDSLSKWSGDKWETRDRSPAQVKAIESKWLAERSIWEKQVLQEGVSWSLLTTRPNKFFQIYGAAANPVSTTQPYKSPFAEALIAHLHKEAELHPDVMTREARISILSHVKVSSDAPVEDRRIAGVDIDHPYVLEYLKVRDEGKNYNRLVQEVRVNAFNPPADLPLTFDDIYRHNESTIDNSVMAALTVKEARALDQRLSQHPITAENLQEVMKMHREVSLCQGFANTEQDKAAANGLLGKFTEHSKAVVVACQTAEFSSLVNDYHYLNRKRLFDSQPHLRNELGGIIIEQIVGVKRAEWTPETIEKLSKRNPEMLHAQLGVLLDRSPQAGSDFTAPDPQLRKMLSQLITQDIKNRLPAALDNNTPAYSEAVMREVQAYGEKTSGLLRAEVVRNVADAVVAQPELAYKLRDYNYKKEAIKSIKNDMYAGIAEGGFEYIKEEPKLRASLLEFLSRPLDESSITRAHEGLANHIFRSHEPALQRDSLRSLHLKFWDSPLEARIAILNDVVFPPGTDPQTVAHITDRILDRTLGSNDKPFAETDLMPPKNTATSARKGVASNMGQSDNSKTARLIVKSYVDTVAKGDPKEAQLLVTALMSAEHSRAPGEPMRLGQTLHVVLSNMGPAGAKLLQAIHSHPSTPEDIRQDLKYSKIEHDKPVRWEAIDLMKKAGLLDESKTTRVGKVVGAGSFGVTLFNEAPDGKTYADTLLRTNAEAISAREFQFMLEAADIIAKEDPKMAPVVEMIREAQYSARIETQMGLAAKQNVIAKQVMDGIQVSVKDADGTVHKFTHHVTDMVENGEQYKRVHIAEGNHFLQLPENVTPQYRQAAAYAMATMQITQRMAGMPVDRDRHGGNIKIENYDINHFDFGMTDVTLATDAQKQALGKVIAQATKDTARGGDFTAHLLERIDSMKGNAEVTGFMAGFKRDMLALGDYFNIDKKSEKAPAKSELTGILGKAMYGEHVDPVIQQSFKKELGIFAGKAESYFKAAMAESSVEITNVPSRENLKMPEITPAEQAIIARPDHVLTTKAPPTRLARVAHVASVGGMGLGVYGVAKAYFGDEYKQDLEAGGARAAYAKAALGLQVGGLAAGLTGIETAAGNGLSAGATKISTLLAGKVIEDTAQLAKASSFLAGAAKAGKFLGPAGTIIQIAAGGFQYQAAKEAGDAYRATNARGSTIGGIVAGVGTGFAVGWETGPGAVLTMVGGGLVGGFVGGKVDEVAFGKDLQKEFDVKTQAQIDVMRTATDTMIDDKTLQRFVKSSDSSQKYMDSLSAYYKAEQLAISIPADAQGKSYGATVDARHALEQAAYSAKELPVLMPEKFIALQKLREDIGTMYARESLRTVPESDIEGSKKRVDNINALAESYKKIQVIVGIDAINSECVNNADLHNRHALAFTDGLGTFSLMEANKLNGNAQQNETLLQLFQKHERDLAEVDKQLHKNYGKLPHQPQELELIMPNKAPDTLFASLSGEQRAQAFVFNDPAIKAANGFATLDSLSAKTPAAPVIFTLPPASNSKVIH